MTGKCFPGNHEPFLVEMLKLDMSKSVIIGKSEEFVNQAGGLTIFNAEACKHVVTLCHYRSMALDGTRICRFNKASFDLNVRLY